MYIKDAKYKERYDLCKLDETIEHRSIDSQKKKAA